MSSRRYAEKLTNLIKKVKKSRKRKHIERKTAKKAKKQRKEYEFRPILTNITSIPVAQAPFNPFPQQIVSSENSQTIFRMPSSTREPIPKPEVPTTPPIKTIKKEETTEEPMTISQPEFNVEEEPTVKLLDPNEYIHKSPEIQKQVNSLSNTIQSVRERRVGKKVSIGSLLTVRDKAAGLMDVVEKELERQHKELETQQKGKAPLVESSQTSEIRAPPEFSPEKPKQKFAGTTPIRPKPKGRKGKTPIEVSTETIETTTQVPTTEQSLYERLSTGGTKSTKKTYTTTPHPTRKKKP